MDVQSRESSAVRLSASTKLFYWFGQYAEGLFNAGMATFTLFYYNQVLGVPGALCGLAILIATCVDAVVDPLMGSVSDGWRSRLGRRHPFMYASAVPLGLCFFLLFNPMVTTEFARFVWLVVFAVLTRFSMGLYHVPHMAVGAEMTSDYHERNSLVAFRMMFGALGQMTVSYVAFDVFFKSSPAFPNGQLNPAAYPPLAAVLGMGMCFAILATSIGTRHLVPRLPVASPSQKIGAVHLVKDMKLALSSTSFLCLIGGYALAEVPVGIGGGMSLYMYTFFWRIPAPTIPIITFASLSALIAGYALSPMLLRRLEKRQALCATALVWAVIAASPVTLHYAHAFPAPHTAWLVAALAVFVSAGSFVVGPRIIVVASMLADIADEVELGTGKRQAGALFGVYSFVLKATGGVGAALGGVVLDLIHWPRGAAVRTAANIPHDTLFNLSMIAGPGVVIGIFPAILLWRRYTLDKRRHIEVLEQLRAQA